MTTRIRKLQATLRENAFDAVLVSSYANVVYLTEFAGKTLQERGDAFLLITQDEQFFLTYPLYADAVKKHLGEYQFLPISRARPLPLTLTEIVEKKKLQKIAYEAFDLRVAELQNITNMLSKKLFVPADVVSPLRLIKTSQEIVAIQEACQVEDQVFSQILPKITEKTTEKMLAAEIDFAIKKLDAEIAFSTIVAFGGNAAFPHHVPSKQKVKNGDCILMDVGTKVANYCSDMTRTVFFGKASLHDKNVYQTVLDALQKSTEFIQKKLLLNESIKANEVDQVGRDYIVEKGYPPFQHMSHGIGIDVHEAPVFSAQLETLLEENMVFTIEPGIYLVDDIGVRIEDVFTIQKNKLVQLTTSSKDLIEI
ncbi:MAG: Xaa-Pro peptidase family protein [Patescibacteria group bacterium]